MRVIYTTPIRRLSFTKSKQTIYKNYYLLGSANGKFGWIFSTTSGTVATNITKYGNNDRIAIIVQTQRVSQHKLCLNGEHEDSSLCCEIADLKHQN